MKLTKKRLPSRVGTGKGPQTSECTRSSGAVAQGAPRPDQLAGLLALLADEAGTEWGVCSFNVKGLEGGTKSLLPGVAETAVKLIKGQELTDGVDLVRGQVGLDGYDQHVASGLGA